MKRRNTMYMSATCSCEAHLELDVVPGDESGAWGLLHRFANAHAEHGYVTSLQQQHEPQQNQEGTLKDID